MAQNFIAFDREQPFLLPPDVREWLPEDHLAWFVIDAVGVMNLERFYAAYREDGRGRAAYEPAAMAALLLYCWARGVRSSRAIERACVEDVACRVIAAQQRPDHATIARFVERHERALGELSDEVLGLCAGAALATVRVIAIDGTKVAANAAAMSCPRSWPATRVGADGCGPPLSAWSSGAAHRHARSPDRASNGCFPTPWQQPTAATGDPTASPTPGP